MCNFRGFTDPLKVIQGTLTPGLDGCLLDLITHGLLAVLSRDSYTLSNQDSTEGGTPQMLRFLTSGLTTLGVTVKLQSPISLFSMPQAGTGNNPKGDENAKQYCPAAKGILALQAL